MSQSKPDGFQQRLLEFDATAPLATARTIPASWYHDRDVHTQELDTVFSNSWQIVDRAELLVSPGSYITTEIGNEPVVVVRDEKGALKAFSNVCRHRAALIQTERTGVCSQFRCPYHGWIYSLDGALTATPDCDNFDGDARDALCLPQFQVEVAGPYVWVRLNPRQGTSLHDVLGPLAARLSAEDIASLRHIERREYQMQCNWKVFVDNYQDGGYHVPFIHTNLSAGIDYKNYRTEIHDYTTVQISPMRNQPNAPYAETRSGDESQYWWTFPNAMFNFYDGVMDAHWVIPDGPERCTIVMDWFFPQHEDDNRREWIEQSIRVSDEIQIEDVKICEQVQHGLRSRTWQSGVFSARREEPVLMFHRLLHRFLSTEGIH